MKHSLLTQQLRPWRLTLLVTLAFVVALAIQFAHLWQGPRGDFPNHWEFGRRMAAGESIYAQGLNVVYPPLWSLVHAPLTIVSPQAAQMLVFPLTALALAALLAVLYPLTQRHFGETPAQFGSAAAIAVLLAGRFLFRDMVECGANLALVALTWLSIYCWAQRSEWLGGLWLGLAISLKCTPVAVLAYFLWKREWKMGAATLLATLLFTLAPALWMGPKAFGDAMSLWSSYAVRGLAEQDPHAGVLGAETLQNLSLRPALAAVLLPRLDGSFLSPVAAAGTIKALLAVLALWVAWKFRHRVVDRRSPEVLWESAIISLAMLLYSPITWTQHCVGVIPAMVLLMLSARVPRRVPRWAWVVLGAYVLAVLVFNRAVMGRDGSLMLLSYHVPTWSIFALFIVSLACRQRAIASTLENALANSSETCTVRRHIAVHT